MYSEACEGAGTGVGLSRTKEAGCPTSHLGSMATPFVAHWLTWVKLQQNQTLKSIILVALSKFLLYVGYGIINLHYVKFLFELLFQGYILSPISSWVTETKKLDQLPLQGNVFFQWFCNTHFCYNTGRP